MGVRMSGTCTSSALFCRRRREVQPSLLIMNKSSRLIRGNHKRICAKPSLTVVLEDNIKVVEKSHSPSFLRSSQIG